MMRTVDRALRILEFFSIDTPEHGLSEIARLAGHDKATTLRLLTALAHHGFVEQHPQTKKYRLGKSVLRLARIRETSFPVASVIQPLLERLAASTGETAHASLASGRSLVTIGIPEPRSSMRVHISPVEVVPYHATASGIALLAYAGEDSLNEVLSAGELTRYTDHTIVTADGLRRQLAETRKRGFAVSARSFENEVVGIAAPIFDWSGRAYGAIAVASVAARLNVEKKRRIAAEVLKAAIEATRAMGAEPHPTLLIGGKELAA